ncbi:MAG: aryldialkylphosphatase [Casimicrobiaceae bacterium]
MSVPRGMVQTVLGPVPPEAVGRTLMHEHVLCDLTPPELAVQQLPATEIRLDNLFEIRHHWGCRHPGHHVLDDRDLAVSELARFTAAGGSTIVELTCEGIAQDPGGLAEVARRTGLHIVAGSGPYVEAYLDAEQRNRTVDEVTAAMVRAVESGSGDTNVCAGILGEIGLSTPFTAVERCSLIAAAQAQQATGAAINIHPPRSLEGTLEAIAVLDEARADIERVVISHVDRTLFTVEDMERVADTGAVLEFDFFGIESAYYPFADVDLPNDGQRIRVIVALVGRGHGGRIVVAHDICTRTRLRRFGGHGYGHLLENAVPLMLRRGLTDEDVAQILVHTPRRLLAFA